MDEHPNAAVIRRMGDAEDLTPVDFATDDVVWHVIGRDEPYRGKAELQAAFGTSDYVCVGERTHDVLANDDHAVALVEVTFRRDDVTFTFLTAEIYHMRDGDLGAVGLLGRHRGDQALLRLARCPPKPFPSWP